MKYINLHNNTEYSFLDSLIKIEELVKESAKQGLDAVVLTDHNNLFGLGIFLETCKKYNIKPIIGLDLDVQNYRFILLAKNYEGYLLLNKFSFKALSHQVIDFVDLENENLFIIDHPKYGIYAQTKGQKQLGINNYYVNSNDENIQNSVYIKENKLMWAEDYNALTILQQIANLPISDPINANYFDVPEASEKNLINIESIVKNCNVIFPEKAELDLPNLANLKENNAKLELLEKLNQGIKNHKKSLQKFTNEIVHQRLNYEYEIICQLGFEKYFLIIADLVSWAKSNDIAIGPGRGSAAGSLISYILGITNINPLDYGLLFERFLNPDRVSWPDIDIDIQDDRRNEVIDYLFKKYGTDNVGLISTFQTIGAKMAIRDVGRVLEIPLVEVDQISKSIKEDENLQEAWDNNLIFRKLIQPYPNLFNFASAIEGQPRQQGIHAAGIVLSSKKLSDIVPICPTNDNLYQQVQLPMNYLEMFGLLKIDLLGLKTLTEIKEIEKYLKKEQLFENIINKDYLEMNDPLTLSMLNNGLTEGIFQLESPGMKKTINKVKLNSFNDLYAIISLFRPGPLKYIDDYATFKKNPKLIEKIHPIYDSILDSTYGIIVYQEQIMQIAQKVALMSFGQADLLRRAISKKNEVEIQKHRTVFFEGALKNKVPANKINLIYDNIEKFASYGFNKSHAVAYAFLTMKMAYYKARYPYYFYASLISNSRGHREKIGKYAEEIKNLNISVQSPEIRYSSKDTRIVNNQIFLPFEMIKGFGLESTEKILEFQKNANFNWDNIFEVFAALKIAGLKDNNINLLIKSNVFRNYGNMLTIEKAFESANQYIKYMSYISEDQKNKEKNYLSVLNFQEFLTPIDIAYEASKEIELLGMIYNAFPTVMHEVPNHKLINLVKNLRDRIVVQIIEIKKISTKNIYLIRYCDSSLMVTSFVSISEMNKRPLIKKGDLIKAEISTWDNKYKLWQWEVIK